MVLFALALGFVPGSGCVRKTRPAAARGPRLASVPAILQGAYEYRLARHGATPHGVFSIEGKLVLRVAQRRGTLVLLGKQHSMDPYGPMANDGPLAGLWRGAAGLTPGGRLALHFEAGRGACAKKGPRAEDGIGSCTEVALILLCHPSTVLGSRRLNCQVSLPRRRQGDRWERSLRDWGVRQLRRAGVFESVTLECRRGPCRGPARSGKKPG